jgi:hypothetical protein
MPSFEIPAVEHACVKCAAVEDTDIAYAGVQNAAI